MREGVAGLKVQKISSLFDYNGAFLRSRFPIPPLRFPATPLLWQLARRWTRAFWMDGIGAGSSHRPRHNPNGEGDGEDFSEGGLCRRRCSFRGSAFYHCNPHGQEAARSIDSDLLGTKPYMEFVGEFTEIPSYRDKTYLRTPWQLPSCQPSKLRVLNQNLVKIIHKRRGASPVQPLPTVPRQPCFDGELCIKCNGCVDVLSLQLPQAGAPVKAE